MREYSNCGYEIQMIENGSRSGKSNIQHLTQDEFKWPILQPKCKRVGINEDMDTCHSKRATWHKIPWSIYENMMRYAICGII